MNAPQKCKRFDTVLVRLDQNFNATAQKTTICNFLVNTVTMWFYSEFQP